MRNLIVLTLVGMSLVFGVGCSKKAESASKGGAASKQVASGDVANGKKLFTAKTCNACHQMDKKMVGPPLKGVVAKRGKDWVTKMIQSPDKMVQTDAAAKKLFEEYNKTPMPNLNLTEAEVRDIVAYLESEG